MLLYKVEHHMLIDNKKFYNQIVYGFNLLFLNPVGLDDITNKLSPIAIKMTQSVQRPLLAHIGHQIAPVGPL